MTDDVPEIKAIYTDGACSGNPGPGGWGTVIYFVDGQIHELGGYEPGTTNNRMEMQAAIAALQFLQQHDYHTPIELNTDSKYLIHGITQWMRGWKRKGWKTAAGKAVLNKDLWLALDELTQTLNAEQKVAIDWNYVKGHAGNVGNERCDEIARAFSQKRTISLKKSVDANAGNSSNPAAGAVVKPNPKSRTPKNVDPQTKIPLPTIDTTLSDMSDTRINRVSNMLKLLQTADELAKQGYLITTSELVVLTGVSAIELAKRGDDWTWRNWTVSCVSSESDQEKFWQLERIGE
ncbi:ribonuclease h [Leptolyngbya sp. Heron Island J]|uniref:ribonuclease HI n=1 Tax=Leptolyngbya sp. Heron Island J TaxID=1385935 RepID=UPI0003B9BAAE|nr:ribonuclease HI [Leptolyngbya sp. Heron Island J]ESA38996.1 ribonuclease h [Leptolyngbya sp. Heron Island J]